MNQYTIDQKSMSEKFAEQRRIEESARAKSVPIKYRTPRYDATISDRAVHSYYIRKKNGRGAEVELGAIPAYLKRHGIKRLLCAMEPGESHAELYELLKASSIKVIAC